MRFHFQDRHPLENLVAYSKQRWPTIAELFTQDVMTDNYSAKTMWKHVLTKTCKGVKSKRGTKQNKRKKEIPVPRKTREGLGGKKGKKERKIV